MLRNWKKVLENSDYDEETKQILIEELELKQDILRPLYITKDDE